MSQRKLNHELATGKAKKLPESSAQNIPLNPQRLRFGGLRYLWGQGVNVNLGRVIKEWLDFQILPLTSIRRQEVYSTKSVKEQALAGGPPSTGEGMCIDRKEGVRSAFTEPDLYLPPGRRVATSLGSDKPKRRDTKTMTAVSPMQQPSQTPKSQPSVGPFLSSERTFTLSRPLEI